MQVIFQFGDDFRWELDDELRELRHGENRIQAQPKVLALLLHLVRNRDRVVPKDELLDILWPNETVGESSLTRAIRGARKALEDSGQDQRVIENARGLGYRFIAPVREQGTNRKAGSAPAGWNRGRFFVGREDSLRALDQHLDRAFSGERQLVLISGPPGIGKTSLAEAFAARAKERVAECLIGRCVEAEGSPPFWPWAQIMRRFSEGRSPAVLRDLLGPGATDLVQTLPSLAEFLPELPSSPVIDPAQTLFRLHASFAGFLRRASQTRPLVILLDDLHRADSASLGLLQHLAHDLHDVGIAFVGTLRDTTPVDGHRAELLASLRRIQPEGALPLLGLGQDEAAEFVARSTGEAPEEAWVHSLLDRTQGNPLFLGELLSHRDAESDLLPRSAGVREAIRRHLEDLSDACCATLQVAALLGRDFGLSTLARALDRSTEETLLRLDEAVSGRIVEPAAEGIGAFRFRHGLIPEVLVSALPPSERARSHDAVGRALLGQYGPEPGQHSAEIAHHFVEAASIGERQRAVDACIVAAEYASEVSAFSEAARHTEVAFEVMETGPSSPTERAAMFIRMGERSTEAGDLATARERLRRGAQISRAIGDVALFAKSALGSQWADETGQVDEERLALLSEARSQLQPNDSADHVRVLAALSEASYFVDPPEHAIGLSADAVAMARRVGSRAALTMALRARHVVLRHPDGLEERELLATEWIDMAEHIGDRVQLAHALGARFQDALERGDRERLRQSVEAYSRIARELRGPYFAWHAALHESALTLLSGEIPRAEAHSLEALALGEAAQSELSTQWFGVQIFHIRREQGRLEELRPFVEKLVQDYPIIATWRAALALVDVESGDLTEAGRRLRDLLSDDLSGVRKDVNTLITLAVLAEVARAVGDADAGAALERRLLPYRDRFVAIGLSAAGYGACSRYLAMSIEAQGRWDEALGLYRQAIESDSRLGSGAHTARGQVDAARVLIERGAQGDREAATDLLDIVDEACEGLGLVRLAEDAHAARQSLQGAIPLPRRRSRPQRP